MKLITIAGCVALASATTLVSATSTLKQVVVLSRHGIRGPYGLGEETPSEQVLSKYIRNPNIQLPLSAVEWGTSDDPNEGVSPKLTKHGYRVVEKMGEYFRQHLYRDFLQGTPCNQSFAYADANQRDNLTAEAFIKGAFSQCKDVTPITTGSQLLFEQGQDPTATCPVCSHKMYQGITGADDCRYLVQEYAKEIDHLNEILDCCSPQVCRKPAATADVNGSHACSFFDIKPEWSGAFYQPWKDTLSSADYFTEFLMLQALNNMTLPWPFTFHKVREFSKVHEAHMDLVTNDVNSVNFGSTLLAHITASFEQAVTGKAVATPAEADGPQLNQGPDNRFLYYAGHDINILYLRNLLRGSREGGTRTSQTPGGMLIFELRERSNASETQEDASVSRRLEQQDRESDSSAAPDRHFVQMYFVTASPEQMRHGDTLSPHNPPDVVPVVIPFCTEEDTQSLDSSHVPFCSFSKFKKLIAKTLKHECVADSLRPFVDSLDNGGGSGGGSSATGAFHTILWALFALLVLVFVAVLARSIANRRQYAAHKPQQEYGTLPQVASD